MAHITLALAATLAAAVLLALAVAPASAADAPTQCPPGCATCEPYTPEELAALRAAHEARRANGTVDADGDDGPPDGPPGRGPPVGGPPGRGPPGGARGNWTRGDGPRGNWTRGDGPRGNSTHGNWTKQKCLTCSDATYKLDKGHCVCVPGYGVPLPDPATFTPGQRPRGPPPACAKCPAGTASGPDAPVPDWAALKAKWQAARAAAGKPPAAGGRRLLAARGAAGKHGKGKGVCVPCPGGKSNDARTACL